jgi:hypothetical protein
VWGGAAAVLRSQLWRAWLCLNPEALRSEWDSPAEGLRLPASLQGIAQSLADQGFIPLGLRLECAPLGPVRRLYEMAHDGSGIFATLYEGQGGDPPHFYLLTPIEGEGFILSANHRRPAGDESRGYLSSGLEGVSAVRLVRAHQRRLAGHSATGPFTVEGREAAAKRWRNRFGRFELRRQNVRGLIWSSAALVAAAAALFSL